MKWTCGMPAAAGGRGMDLPRKLLRPAAVDLALDRSLVMRLLGYKEGRTQLQPQHLALVDRGIAMTVAAATPQVSLAYCAVAVADQTVATLLPGLAWRSRSLARLLRGAAGVYLVAATLGPGVDELVASLFRQEEYALATIADAAGSALIHALGEYVRTALAEEGSLTALYGPGYGDWPVGDQIALTQAAGGPLIGLTSSETCYLEPQKSLVGVMGVGSPGGRGGCSLCTMAGCTYRERGGAHT